MEQPLFGSEPSREDSDCMVEPIRGTSFVGCDTTANNARCCLEIGGLVKLRLVGGLDGNEP